MIHYNYFLTKTSSKMWFGGFHFGFSYSETTKSDSFKLLSQPPAIPGSETKRPGNQMFFFYPAQIIHWFLFTRYALPSLFNKRCLPRDGQSHLTSCKISQPPPTQYDSCLLEEVREERCHTSSHCAPWIKPATVLR